VTCDPKDRRNCSQRLKEGEPAGISGTILSDRKLAKLLSKAEMGDAREKLAKEEAAELQELLKATYEARFQNQEAFHKQEMDLMMRHLKQLEEEAGPEWYEHPVFVAVISVATATAIFYGSVKAVQALK